MIAINAKYAHTSLAMRYFKKCMEQAGLDSPSLLELTVNQSFDHILEQLYLARADVYLFSCYIWNIDLIIKLASALKSLYPGVKLFAGGPQVSFSAQSFLREHPCFDGVLAGEGETSCPALFRQLEKGGLPQVDGLITRAGGNPAPASDVDRLPFPYDDLSLYPDRVLYYESMRGCPYRCSYCLSSASPGLRLKSLPIIFRELDRFLEAGVRRVKFVDRSFNCDRNHALAIWNYLMEHDNGNTNFHFEIRAELLDESAAALLSQARPGLFQFEIGVQSANPVTLDSIDRPCDLGQLAAGIKRLRAPGNIHLHLDLIAGLPYEDMESFGRSFDFVYGLCPHQLQLGFLKLLPGTRLESQAGVFGILCREQPPFEVLSTKWLAYEHLLCLKKVEQAVDLYWNSGRCRHTIAALSSRYASPFDFYMELGAFYADYSEDGRPVSLMDSYEVLGAFATKNSGYDMDRLQWLCRYDLALHDKPKKIPSWIKEDGVLPYRKAILRFYGEQEQVERYLPHLIGKESKHIDKSAHMEVFPFDPETGRQEQTAILFDYSSRNPVTGRATAHRVPLVI